MPRYVEQLGNDATLEGVFNSLAIKAEPLVTDLITRIDNPREGGQVPGTPLSVEREITPRSYNMTTVSVKFMGTAVYLAQVVRGGDHAGSAEVSEIEGWRRDEPGPDYEIRRGYGGNIICAVAARSLFGEARARELEGIVGKPAKSIVRYLDENDQEVIEAAASGVSNNLDAIELIAGGMSIREVLEIYRPALFDF